MEILSVVIASIALIFQGANEYQKIRDKKKKQDAFKFVSRVLELVSRIESESIILVVSIKEKLFTSDDPFSKDDNFDLHLKASVLLETLYDLQVEIRERAKNDDDLFATHRWPLLDVVMKSGTGKTAHIIDLLYLVDFYTDEQRNDILRGYDFYEHLMAERPIGYPFLPNPEEQTPPGPLSKPLFYSLIDGWWRAALLDLPLSKPQFYSLIRSQIIKTLLDSENRIADFTQAKTDLKDYYLDMFNISDLL